MRKMIVILLCVRRGGGPPQEVSRYEVVEVVRRSSGGLMECDGAVQV